MGTKDGVSSLYVLKALCALFVVMLHAPFWGAEVLSPVIRCAVPCFFLISGYFLYSEDLGKVRGKLWKSLRKICVIIVVVNAVYLSRSLMRGSIPSWYSLAEIFVTGMSGCMHLWYLTAYAWGLVLLAIFMRKTDRALYVFPLFIVCNLLMARYSFLLFPRAEFPFGARTNALTVALPIISIGYLFHKYEACLLRFRAVNVLPIVFALLSWAEQYLLYAFRLNNDASYLVCTLPLACSLFLLALSYKDFYIPLVCEIGKYHSANIYYFHIAVAYALSLCIPVSPFICAPVVFVVTLGFSVVLVRMQACLYTLFVGEKEKSTRKIGRPRMGN